MSLSGELMEMDGKTLDDWLLAQPTRPTRPASDRPEAGRADEP